MILTTIEATGLKGRTFKYELGPATVFTGPSFSGKTAALDAVKIGLLGFHPRLGKRPADTIKLAAGGAMRVRLELEQTPTPGLHRTIERGFHLEKGSAKATTEEHDSLLQPAMLDATEYFAMSGPERLRYTLRHVSDAVIATVASDEKIIGELMKLTVEGVEVRHAEEAVKEVCKLAREIAEARKQEDVSIAEALDVLVDRLGMWRRDYDTALKQFEGMAQGSTALKAAEPRAPARSMEAALDQARRKAEGLRSELRTLREALAPFQKWTERVTQLKSEIKRGQNYVDDIKELEVKVLAMEKEVADPCPDPTEADRLATELQCSISAQETDLKNLKAHTAKLKETHERNLKLDCCPFCKSKKKGWQDALIEEYEACVLVNDADKKKREDRLIETSHAFTKATKERDTLRAKRKAYQDTSRVLNDSNRTLNNLKALDKAFEKTRTELATLEASPPAAVDGFRVPELETDIRLAEAEVERLDEEQRRFIGAKANEAQLLKAAVAHDRAKAFAVVFKGAVEAMRGIQREAVDVALADLMKTVNRFTQGIIPHRIEYRDGDLGYTRPGGEWVTHECFSGTEEALTYAGLCVALAAASPLRLVMIDELGIVDGETKRMLLERMIALINEKVIDQFIGADVSASELRDLGLILIPVK